jgi:poly(3-hydroxybutyrate) depolymerase
MRSQRSLFRPLAAAIELGKEVLKLFEANLSFVSNALKMASPPQPEWASPNRVLLDMDTMRLRAFGSERSTHLPVIVDAPYAGHRSTIEDYANEQSLVQTLAGSGRTGWWAATERSIFV